ncbi:recombinase family protein [Roseovarius tibetensis]|uniref:recombinase family protein n=1 Tax=Roseovarius tibetensis TaxID=2685897 RepID=UPI003D7F9522
MIDLYFAPTPNGWKAAIMLEETGLDYRSILMRLSDGDQFSPEFLAISPNAKMPAIVDHAPEAAWGDAPVTVFESGAILLYLADKTGQFAPQPGELRARKEMMEWLFWQVGNQGPMAGQLSHFRNYAPEDARDYGFKRYLGEYDRNLGVLEKRGIRTPRGNRIDKKYLYRMLNNRAYIGEAVHKGESYPGEHDAIIDHETWDRVHAILQESPRKRAARTRADTPALLKGLLFGPDGATFSPTHTRKGGRLYRYYVSQTVLKHGAGACPVGRVPAGEIEAAVIDQLRAVFRQPEIVAGTWKAARAHGDDISEADACAALQQLDPLWDELFPAEQARIVVLLVERVDIGTDGLNVRLRIDGLAGLSRELLTGAIENAA